MLKAQKDSIEELGEKMIVNAGGGLLTAVIDDHYYYDENLKKKKFEDGHTYFPSVLVSALHMSDDLKGESLFYQDREGKPHFTIYKNVSYAMSSMKNEHVTVDDPIRVTATYKHYQDLPSWIGVDRLAKELFRVRNKKKYDLGDIFEDQWIRQKRNIYRETAITTIVLSIQYVLFIPYVIDKPWFMRLPYHITEILILTRFIGRTFRLYLDFKRYDPKK